MKNFLSLLFSFPGRINRKQFWLATVFFLMGVFALFSVYESTEFLHSLLFIPLPLMYLPLIGYASFDTIMETFGRQWFWYGFIVMIIMIITLVIIQFAVSIKRLHDLGQSGWLALLFFVPTLHIFFIFYLGFFTGEDKPNKYGELPSGTWS